MKYAKDPKVRDVDVILCWYCGDEYKKVNLHRHTQRKHPEEKPSWKLRNITPISNFFKSEEENPKKEEPKNEEPKNDEPPKEQSSKKRKRTQSSIFDTFGQLAYIKNNISELCLTLSDPEEVNYLTQIKDVLERIIEHEGDLLKEKKKCKTKREELAKMLRTVENMMSDRDELITSSTKLECEIQLTNDAKIPSKINPDQLNQAEKDFHPTIVNILESHPEIELHDEAFRCNTCYENWTQVGKYSKRPHCEITINRNVKRNVARHLHESHVQQSCFEAKKLKEKNITFYKQVLRDDRKRLEVVTDNIIKLVYFLLYFDLSMTLIEQLINLLTLIENCLVGNQLHSRKTPAAIAIAIDYVYLKLLVKFIISEDWRGFSIICDELTDVGGVKTLLTKLRFFERSKVDDYNFWNLQKFVFSIFESVGTSEEIYEDFVSDFEKIFVDNSNLSVEEFFELLDEKLYSGCTDRCSKVVKFGKYLFENLEKYVHFLSDNHITETSWEHTESDISEVSSVEDLVKQLYSYSKNSTSRTLELKKLSDELGESFLKPKGIFKIKYLTSEERAIRATLTDYEQFIKITLQLSTDTSIKSDKHDQIKQLHVKLKNVKTFKCLLSLKSALEEIISPYQLWGKRRNSCAPERKYKRDMMREIIVNLKITKSLSTNITAQLDKVDFRERRWQKSRLSCNKLGNQPTLQMAIKEIVTIWSRILDTFQSHKDELHLENDPEYLDELSEIFDLRHWTIDVSDGDNLQENILQLKQNLCAKIEEVYDEFHLVEGCNIPQLKVEFCKTIDSLFRNEGILFQSARSHEHLLNQWSGISNIPNLATCEILFRTAERVCLMLNSEAGCEQSNSKYNHAKDKLGSRMGIKMITTRMRDGSNSPPIHLFDPKPIREYWVQNNHKLTEMVSSTDSDDSRVIQRIREGTESKYTSKLFL